MKSESLFARASGSLASRSASARPANLQLSGVVFAILAVMFFACLDTTTKTIGTTAPLLMAIWFRYIVQAIMSTVILLPLHGKSLIRTQQPRFQVLRGALILASSLFAFTSLQCIPVGEFTAIIMLTPLLITALAAVVLKEHVSRMRWSLVLGAFAGAVVIIQPGGANFHWTWLLPLGAVATNACFQILTSRMAKIDNPLTMHFYSGWVGALLSTISLYFVWVPLTGWEVWLRLTLLGVFATIGHFFLTLAYARAPAAVLSPYLYLQIAFAVAGGALVFGHMPHGWSWLGIGMITFCGASGAWLTGHENRRSARWAQDLEENANLAKL